ncbi:hypothetical protein [uncultured Hymenobacter sp.]|uniref:hypothetical protein n=1 Tax=uncultured Hymenobacter sp. TaxID=170016 RepID=UPI0035CA4EE4
MLPAPLTPTSALARWSKHYDLLEAASPTKTHTRKVSNGSCAGREQQVKIKQKPLPGCGYLTGLNIIRLAIQATNEYRNHQMLQLDYQHTDAVPEGILISVSHPQLAKLVKKNKRTVYTHVMALMGGEDSLILQKYFRGWRRNVELVINSKFLFKMVDIRDGVVSFSASAAQGGQVQQIVDSTKLPPIKDPLGLLITTLTDESGKVENPEKVISARTGGADAAGDEAKPETGKKGALGEREARFYQKSKTTPAEQVDPVEAKKAAILNTYSTKLLNKANKFIYKRAFTEEEMHLAQDAIKEGVYHNLDSRRSLEEWADYHRDAMERIRLAAKWFAKHPNRPPSWPYARYTDGPGYFDESNPNGFYRTEAWWQANKTKKEQRKLDDALNLATKEFQEFKDYQRGSKIPVGKRVKNSTAWQLYQYHEHRIRQFGNEKLTRLFYEAVNQSRASAGTWSN